MQIFYRTLVILFILLAICLGFLAYLVTGTGPNGITVDGLGREQFPIPLWLIFSGIYQYAGILWMAGDIVIAATLVSIIAFFAKQLDNDKRKK